MGQIIEAKAVISAEDRTGAAFDAISKKMAAIGKGAKASAEVDRLAKSLTRAEKAMGAVDNFRRVHEGFAQARTNLRSAQVEVTRVAKSLDAARLAASRLDGGFVALKNAKAIAETGRQVREMERAYDRAQRTVKAVSTVFEHQAAAVKGAKAALEGSGVTFSRLGGEQRRLRATIDDTTGAMLRQARGREARDLLIERRRQASGRADVAFAARQAQAARFWADRTGPRSEAAQTDPLMAGAVGLGVGALAKRTATKVVSSWAEMDEASRRQAAILDVTPAQQSAMLAQAVRIGQDTRFSNPDVVKGQTRIGSSLPNHLKDPAVITAITEQAKNYALAMGTTLDEGSSAILGRMLAMRYDMSSPDAAGRSAKHAANRLVQFAKSSGADHNDVMGYTKFGAAPGSIGGFSEEFADAMGAQLRRIGYEGSMVGNFVRAAATKLAVPTQKGLTALASAGIEHDDYVSRDKRMDVDNLEKVVAGKYGKKLNASQRRRIGEIFEDEEIVGKREEFVPAVSGILQETLAKRTKKGKVNAKDAESIAGAVNAFLSASAGATDIERLMKDVIAKGITPALGKYLFGQEHGGRAMALDLKTLEKDQASFRNTPDNRASKMADDTNFGFYGAMQRAIGSIETFYMTLGRVNDGPLTAGFDKFGNAVDAISNLPDKLLQFGSAVGGATSILLGVKGAAAVGALAGIPGAAAVGGAAGRLIPGVGGAIGAAMLADAVGEGANAIGSVAAGRFWAPTDESTLNDLRERRSATEARIAGIHGRTHPSMRGAFNPEVDRLQREVQDLTHRIGGEQESVRESRRATAFSRLPDPATIPPPGTRAPLPPDRPREFGGVGSAPIEAKVTEPIKVDPVELKGQAQVTVTVAATGPGEVTGTTAFGSGHVRASGGAGRSMPGATNANRVSSPGGQGGV